MEKILCPSFSSASVLSPPPAWYLLAMDYRGYCNAYVQAPFVLLNNGPSTQGSCSRRAKEMQQSASSEKLRTAT